MKDGKTSSESPQADQEHQKSDIPSIRVQSMIDMAEKDEDAIDSSPLFSEMVTLTELPNGDFEWRETARWVKFEELVEEGGTRWSKPHVSTLPLNSVFELRSCFSNGTVILDMDATNLNQIVKILAEVMISQGVLPVEAKEKFWDIMLKNHVHLHEKTRRASSVEAISKLPIIRRLSDAGRTTQLSDADLRKLREIQTYSNFEKKSSFLSPDTFSDASYSKGNLLHPDSSFNGTLPSNPSYQDFNNKGNKPFMKKIPPGSEASNILVGEVPFLDRPLTVFVRLANSVILGNVTEVQIPTRFIFVALGPPGGLTRYQELGRSIATLLGDEVFKDIAFIAKKKDDLLAGLDEFLDSVTILPPAEWDPAIRIEPPSAIPSQEGRKKGLNEEEEEIDEEEEESRQREAAGLTRSGRLFGGLINDLKRKAPWYLSEFKDGIAVQSVGSFFFLYFACLTPIVTFGGLMGEGTGNYIGAMESLVSGMICGVIFGLFAGQPLTILGSTGPVMVFEIIIYDFCQRNEWDFLSFRMWIGLWAAAILLLLVAIDASAMVCYITRFTEENFATLISLIFIFKALEKVALIGEKYPMEMHIDKNKSCECFLGAENETSNSNDWLSFSDNYTIADCKQMNGTLVGDGCKEYYSDVFLLSIILFIGTYLITVTLKGFKTSGFFPTWVRKLVNDFAVVIAILSMTFVDMVIGIHTPKLLVPSEFKPTRSDRGWFIDPFGVNPWYSCLIAIVPAILACILFFMDQQITAVIVNRKEHKLKKGGGYHLDLLILAMLTALCSFMGLPWFVAATVRSINHVNSLRLETECAAPGEKPQFLGIRENRVTQIMISLFIGFSVLMTPVLKFIPMPVLFGVFLFMGISPLKEIQLYQRILIMFMPVKYQPDYSFLRKVELRKVHIYTIIQVACLGGLMVIKVFPETSILFPLMLVVMVGVRKMLDYFFTQRELKVLDDALPEFKRKERQQKDEERELEETKRNKKEGTMSIHLENGSVMRVPMKHFNITDEVQKRNGVWKNSNGCENISSNEKEHSGNDSCTRCTRRRRQKAQHQFQIPEMSYIDSDADLHEEDSSQREQNQKMRWDLTDVLSDEERQKLNKC